MVDATESDAVLVVAAGGGGGGGANIEEPFLPGGAGGEPYADLSTGDAGGGSYGPGGAGGPGAASGAPAGNDGGTPESATSSGGGGGGGGGYYDPTAGCLGGGDGGAGGGWASFDAGGGGGGAGASYAAPEAQNVTSDLSTQSDGDGQVTISWSAPPAPTTTTLSLSSNSVAAGSVYTVGATVTGGGPVPPSGAIELLENGQVVDSGDVTDGYFGFNALAPLTAGTVTWQAVFHGDNGGDGQPPDAPSNSQVEVETVTAQVLEAAETTTSIVLAPDRVVTGKAYTVTATVEGTAGVTPTGTVEFSSNGHTVASETLNGSNPDVATFTAKAPAAPGSVTWTADYSGDAHNDSSDSSAVSESVVAPKPVVSSVAPATGSAGAQVSLTGKNLEGATKVLFGKKTATFSCTSASSCSATAPSGLTGTVHLYVVTPAGTSKLDTTATFTYTD